MLGSGSKNTAFSCLLSGVVKLKIAIWFSSMVVMALAALIAGMQGNIFATACAFLSVAGSAFLFMQHFVDALQSALPQSELTSTPETTKSNG